MATGSKRGGAARGGRTAGKTRNSRKNNTGRRRVQQKADNIVFDEVVLLLVLAVSVLLFLSDLKLLGGFGKTVGGVLFGLFGLGAFLIPFALFFTVAFVVSNRGKRVVSTKAGASVFLSLVVCSLLHLMTMKGREGLKITEVYKICLEERTGGGFFGGLISGLLVKAVGRAGAYIILFVFLIICAVIITERSFIRGIKKGSKSIYDRSLEGAKRQKEVMAARSDIMKNERELRNRERAIKREEAREERLRTLELREEALMEQRRKRNENKVTGVMLDTRVNFEEKEAVLDVEKELSRNEAENAAVAETITEAENAVIESLADEGTEKALLDEMHEINIENIRSIMDRRAERIWAGSKTEELDAVNFKSSHHITLEPAYAGEKERGVASPDKAEEVVLKPEREKIVPIAKRTEETGKLPEKEELSWEDRIPDLEELMMRVQEPEEEDKNREEDEEELSIEDFSLEDLMVKPEPEKTVPDKVIPEKNTSEKIIPEKNMTGMSMTEISMPEISDIEIKAAHLKAPEAQNSPETGFILISPDKRNDAPQERRHPGSMVRHEKEHKLPPVDLLDRPERDNSGDTGEELGRIAMKLKDTLATFGVSVTMTEISQGPTVTRFEMQPEVGVKVSKILSLSDDIKLNMAATDVRIEAPIPGKAAIGIEIPNKNPSTVSFRELMEADAFKKSASNVSFAVGKDIEGNVVVTDIAKMPHLLIAGATGSGKSVCINTLIMSILYKADPEDVKLIMIDPKVVELSVYNGIPHLMIPVVTDPKKASAALQWGVAEMDDRYNKFAEFKVRDMKSYNKLVASDTFRDVPEEERPEKMPQIVIIVDELADLMMVASKEVEESICRIAQKARAAGIHLVIATQRPSVDVITGLIKANMPSRIAFSVSSGTDSRTILDMVGAEKLLGKGDMLFYPQGYSKPARLQGAFVSDEEVTRVVDFLKEQAEGENYDPSVIKHVNEAEGQGSSQGISLLSGISGDNNGNDELFEKAARFIIEKDKASIGMLQRAFKIGFNRAARIMDQLAEAGVVGEEEGTKPRKILMSDEQFDQYVEEVL